MKKLSILLLAVFYIGIANVSAQTDATTETITAIEEVQEANKDCPFTKTEDGKLICTKTGKICDPASCKNKSKCCKGKKSSCKGKKSKTGSFNFNKSNNYGAKSSCSKAKTQQKECGEDCTKACCAANTEETEEVTADEEVAPTDE